MLNVNPNIFGSRFCTQSGGLYFLDTFKTSSDLLNGNMLSSCMLLQS